MRKIVSLLIFTVASVLGCMAQELPELYLRGSVNGWDASEQYRFSRDGNTYTLHLDHFEGNFKIAEADWGGIEYGADTPGDNQLNVVAGSYPMKRAGGKNYACEGLDDVTFSFDYVGK